jgi:hypothetical protein
MTNFITKAALAAVVALGAFGAAAQADAAQVKVVVKTPHVVVRKPVVVVKPAPVVRKRVVVVKPAPVVVAGRCAPALALQKAANHGLNRVSVSFVGPNRVTVSGKVRGAFAKMNFANVRGCPAL